jgi:uncharacterized protein YjbJ (UPF0337 family)
MKPSTRDQAVGMANQVKGKVKAKAGQLVGNPRLEMEGRIQNASGRIQKKIGQMEKALEE